MCRINKSKSEIMPTGKGCITESEQQRYGLKICENDFTNTSPNPIFSKTLNIYSWLSLSKAFSWSAFIIYPSKLSFSTRVIKSLTFAMLLENSAQ
jgi:hypothetical protein